VSDLANPDTQPGQNEIAQFEQAVASLQHYTDNPSMYVTRLEPERLNWGKWMTAAELDKASLKANRVSLPGDWDFAGVCRKVDGDWKAA